MRNRPFALTLLLVAGTLPLVPGAAAWTCVPAQDQTASTLGLGIDTYYNRLYTSGSSTVEEFWEETNSEPGLQLSSGMSCVGKADRLVTSACLGCPTQM